MKRYLVPEREHRVSEEILRSRFLTIAAPAPTVGHAQALLASLRHEFPDATHHCWAYLVGPPGSSGQVGMSDDGEPHGTAGRPMLQVLSHCGIGDIACVVVRYYGGTNLGTGGLVRAYSGGVKLVLQTLPTREKVTYRTGQLILPYPHVTQARKLMSRHEVEIRQEVFETDVSYRLAVPEEAVALFARELEDLTAGEAVWEIDPAGGS